jgi:shikimate dehydrogenase
VLDQRWTLRGIDLPTDTYRRLLAAMRNNPRVRGAVITAHKLRLYRGPDIARRLVDLTREINTLVTDDTSGGAAGYANDARSLTAILGSFAGSRIVRLGVGGAATALLLALHLEVDSGAPPPGPPHGVRRHRHHRPRRPAGRRGPDRRQARHGAPARSG